MPNPLIPILAAGARYIARQGLAGFGKKVVLPAVGAELLSRAASEVTGVPQEYIDAAQYAVNPNIRIVGNALFRSGLVKFPVGLGKAVAHTGTNLVVDAIPGPNVSTSTPTPTSTPTSTPTFTPTPNTDPYSTENLARTVHSLQNRNGITPLEASRLLGAKTGFADIMYVR